MRAIYIVGMERFAEILKRWRTARRLSQLDLALEANVSSRHISFLETGRAQPSREMIARLGEALHVPLEARNTMLTYAGYAAQYPKRDWDAEDMVPIRTALEHTLSSHSPYPAIALDRLWNVVRANDTALALFGPVGVAEGGSLIDLMLSNQTQSLIENWPEVAHHVSQRMRTESAAAGGIERLDKAADELAAVSWDRVPTKSPVTPTIYRFGAQRIALFSTIAQFGTPVDLALDDMKVELFFPADKDTEEFLRLIAG